MNVNPARSASEPATETDSQRRTTADHPAAVTQFDDEHESRPGRDARKTIVIVFGFVAALAMLVGLNMK